MYNTACLQEMKEDFLNTLQQSQDVTAQQAQLSLWQRLIAEPLKLFSPLM
jgi:hypothetical protein